MDTKKITWEKGEKNSLLRGKNFTVSYNPNTRSDQTGAIFDDLLNGIMGTNGGGEETALIKDKKFYILNGDFRKEYEKELTAIFCMVSLSVILSIFNFVCNLIIMNNLHSTNNHTTPVMNDVYQNSSDYHFSTQLPMEGDYDE